jgi:hypothetical protein
MFLARLLSIAPRAALGNVGERLVNPAVINLAHVVAQEAYRDWPSQRRCDVCFVDEELWRVLPAARDPATGGFDTSRLHAPWTPADPLRDQYVRGNIDRSARYTLIEPATAANRPEPAPAGLVNLRFAGDWTKNGVDVPCMEGTVTSALLAVNSILGALDAVEILT